METLQAIINRRSTRKFKEENIEQEKLLEIAKAGAYAPSAKNKHPIKFLIIDNKEITEKIGELFKQDNMTPHYYSAPAMVLLYSDEFSETALLDCGATMQTMALRAYDLGIGSCWIRTSGHQSKLVKEFLKLDPNTFLMDTLILGYDDNYQAPKRIIEDVIQNSIKFYK